MEKVFKNKKTGEIAYYKDGILKVNNCAVEIGHEPSLEFWDLIEETVLTTTDGVDLKFGEEYFILDCETYKSYQAIVGIDFIVGEGYSFSTRKSVEDWLLMYKPVFSLDDVYLHLSRLNIPFSTYSILSKSFHGLAKDKIEPVKNEIETVKEETVFTTNDGVNLKFGDKYFVVDTSRFNIFEASAGITFKTERWEGCGFSTRKLAEEWVLMNKPLLSLEDLLSVWGVEPKKEVYNISPLFVRFKELADKKLKN